MEKVWGTQGSANSINDLLTLDAERATLNRIARLPRGAMSTTSLVHPCAADRLRFMSSCSWGLGFRCRGSKKELAAQGCTADVAGYTIGSCHRQIKHIICRHVGPGRHMRLRQGLELGFKVSVGGVEIVGDDLHDQKVT